jgi:hypothetical protein
MLNHEENQRFTDLGSDVVAIDLYGIPITFFCIPSRIPMQWVTPSGAGMAAFVCALLIRQDRTPPSGFCCPTGDFIARSIPMMDVVMLAIGFVFFALSIGYVYACDRL